MIEVYQESRQGSACRTSKSLSTPKYSKLLPYNIVSCKVFRYTKSSKISTCKSGDNSLAIHIILAFLLIKLSLLFCCRILVLLVLTDQIVHIGLSFGKFHLPFPHLCTNAGRPCGGTWL